jgi:hypothetical protein
MEGGREDGVGWKVKVISGIAYSNQKLGNTCLRLVYDCSRNCYSRHKITGNLVKYFFTKR